MEKQVNAIKNRIQFREDEFLKANKLKEGHVYLAKDGRVMLYLGQSESGLYVFYTFGSVVYNYLGNFFYTLANYDYQVKHTTDLCKHMMWASDLLLSETIVEMKGIPKIHCEFSYVNYEYKYAEWYSRNRKNESESMTPVLAKIAGVEADRGFVKAGDLIPGNLYYAGTCWRNTWVYLGRASNNSFVWFFIGDEDMLVKEGVNLVYDFRYRNDIEVSKQLKKVKPLAEALNDKKASVFKEDKMLVEMDYKMDVSSLTQEKLDRLAGIETKGTMSPVARGVGLRLQEMLNRENALGRIASNIERNYDTESLQDETILKSNVSSDGSISKFVGNDNCKSIDNFMNHLETVTGSLKDETVVQSSVSDDKSVTKFTDNH